MYSIIQQKRKEKKEANYFWLIVKKKKRARLLGCASHSYALHCLGLCPINQTEVWLSSAFVCRTMKGKELEVEQHKS